nr:integrase arm-type DNA-binding domain-containing protein [Alcaligenes faecalis]
MDLRGKSEMAVKKLNDRQIRAAKPRLRAVNPRDNADFVEYALSDGGGLYLIVKPTGAKSWSYLYRSPKTGKNARLGLGLYPQVSLGAARERVESLWELVARGHDPRDVERAEKAAQEAARTREQDTFGRLAKRWHSETAVARRWVKGHKTRQWGLLENWALPELRDIPIADITERQVASLLRAVQLAGKRETALRVRGVIRDVFEYARDLGVPDVPDFVRTARNLGRLHQPTVENFPAITDPARLGELLRAMRGYEGRGVVVRAALNLLPLLAQRPGQVAKMEWSQLDFDNRLWAVPAEIMKMRAGDKSRRPDFLVPLPTQAVEILRDLYRWTGQNQYVFASHRAGRHISDNTLGAALRALGYDTQRDVTPHGFRTTFLTLAQEKFGSEVAAAADRHLGHLPKIEGAASSLGEVYNRAMLLDERRVLIQRWADYLDQLRDAPLADVLPISRAA